MTRTKPTTAAYWRQQFAAQATSGLTTAAYLRREGIRSSQWYYWHKKLRSPANEGAGITLIPVETRSDRSDLLAAQEVRVELPNGIALTFCEVGSCVQMIQALYRLERA
ncbi:MAG: IS66 family insertion sequence element accessory protein TnpA [Gammaproteobacteria bacterium]